MKVVIINKITREVEGVYADRLTPEKAEDICAMWGWNYDDGHRSFWLDTEEE